MGERIPVVVTGGSLVGLSTAMFLADHGVRCVVVERHPDTAIHPRARGYTARTAEVLRRAGLEERLREAGAFGETSGALIRARDLADENFEVLVRPEAATPPGLSPCAMFACDQDRLEPILLQRARELGAQVRFSTELTGFTQDADGVTVTLRHPDGSESAVTCDYLVAADGAHSGIRDALGIGVDQIGRFGHAVSILFNADLDAVAKDRRFFACVVQSVEAGILVRRDDRRWQLVAAFHPERGERLEDFTDARCGDLIRTATGQPDLEVSVTSVLPWEVTAQVAERLAEGRVLIAGDAAHTTTPWGGLGANTGIQDADNLAWKLAAVLNGAAPASLLDTYHSERHPVAEVTVRHAVSLLKQQHGAIDRYAAVTLGYRYVEGALVDDAAGADCDAADCDAANRDAADRDGAEREPEAAAELVEDPARPSGRPGTRAPHVVLQRAGKELSTLDLFGDGFTLLAGPKADGWFEAAAEVAEHSPIRLTAYRIGQDADGGPVDVEDRWSDAYGVQADGAVLVRPDGFIAWRADGDADDAAPVLAGVLTTVLRGGARAGADRREPAVAAPAQGA